MIAEWDIIVKRWLPLIKEMERMGFDDYALPEIYRAAEAHIDQLEMNTINLLAIGTTSAPSGNCRGGKEE